MPSDDRVIVKTTVPASQKERWVELAEQFDMSQSEYLRTMAQAGMHWFDLEPPQPSSPDVNPGSNGLRKWLLEALDEESYIEFDELVAAYLGDVESDFEETLETLKEEKVVNINVRRGVSLNGAPHGDD